jgi:hypothetical protein
VYLDEEKHAGALPNLFGKGILYRPHPVVDMGVQELISDDERDGAYRRSMGSVFAWRLGLRSGVMIFRRMLDTKCKDGKRG